MADPDPDPIKKSDPVASLVSPVEYAIFEQVDGLGSSPFPSSPQASGPIMGSCL